MQLAFSTNAYTRFTLAEALRGIRAAGFGAVEILADTPHAYPDGLTMDQMLSIREQLSALGLAVSNINANCTFGYWRHAPPEAFFEPSLISPNPAHRADRHRLICRTIDFAKVIGAENISITSGRCLGEMSPSRAKRQMAESLMPILDYAEAAGVNVGIECEPGLFIEYAAELRDLIDQLQSARLGANLDIGHSYVLGEDVPTVLQILQGRIWNLHVEDLPGRKHYHMIPGRGDFDWMMLANALRQTGYNRAVTVELYTQAHDPGTAAVESFAFLSEWMKNFPAVGGSR